MRRGLFITGTDTGVGKTVASAAFMHLYRSSASKRASNSNSGTPAQANDIREFPDKSDDSRSRSGTHLVPVRYWKPIQTGIEQDDDTAEVARLGACVAGEILSEGIRLERPLSPHLSARLAGTAITIDGVMRIFERASPGGAWIVEGAGGALVPINEHEMMVDLMVRVGLPVAVIARTALGTINHTLLTLEALRVRALTIAGVVLVGDANEENRNAIATYGAVKILGEMPRFDPLTPQALGAWATAHLALGDAA